jgi:hypothetical protein
MSENEKKNEGQSCCCCKCWGKIFITIALLAIGAVIGHVMTMRHHCCHMRGLCGGYGREACWDRGEREHEGSFEHKFRWEKEGRGEREEKGWFGHKADTGKCKPGCTCPICSKKAASLSEPNKASCPMMGKKEGKSKKD